MVLCDILHMIMKETTQILIIVMDLPDCLNKHICWDMHVYDSVTTVMCVKGKKCRERVPPRNLLPSRPPLGLGIRYECCLKSSNQFASHVRRGGRVVKDARGL
jgi:hypothetical protein